MAVLIINVLLIMMTVITVVETLTDQIHLGLIILHIHSLHILDSFLKPPYPLRHTILPLLNILIIVTVILLAPVGVQSMNGTETATWREKGQEIVWIWAQ